MKIFSSKRRIAVAAALVLLLLFLVRPGASRLKSRIILSLSAAVGRPVDVSSVHVRLLPRPGFDLEGLVVYDDPSFSSEPMLRASEVTADLRLTSLLRGRLEVARLDLTEPSLNLVHRAGGGWNLESLLERTARTPLAPTGRTKSAPRPRFPYIEGTSGRINFKNGAEKKPYALTNADFSLWQESEDAWGVRLRAQPFRSDMNLNDTGLLRVSGLWQRAARVRETPLQFTLEWTRAQLGQVTKFISGSDKGWRGAIQLDAAVTGTPAAVQISGVISADDFRRYDITSGKALRLSARCDAEYEAPVHEFLKIACNAPIGAGLIKVEGNAGLPGSHRYALAITAEKVPASALGAVAQRAKNNLPEDLVVEGTLQGRLSLVAETDSGSSAQFGGRGEITDFRVSSTSENVEMGPQTIPFVLANSVLVGMGRGVSSRRLAEDTRVDVGPFSIEPGRSGTATIRGWVARSGYSFVAVGDTGASRTLKIARMFGIPALSTPADGIVQLNLQIAGTWTGFSGPLITGSAKLRDLHVGLRPTGEPVDIHSADLQFAPAQLRVSKLNADAAGTTWKGSLEIPRGCGKLEACTAHFALSVEQITLGQVSEWEKARSKKRPWYRVLDTSQAAPSLLAHVHASGRLTADRMLFRNVAASKVSAALTLNEGRVEVSSLDAELLGGKLRGKWVADFSVKPAACRGSGSLAGISLGSLADAMKDSWIEGTASAHYEIQGPCSADFWQASEGTLQQVNVTNGSFPHVALGDHGTELKIENFTGQVRMNAGTIEVSDGLLDSPNAKYEVGGTATLGREIEFKIVRDPPGNGSVSYAVTGTLAHPRVAQIGGTEQARLKPPPSK